ncbi:MAG: HD domain-containing protein [Chitinophagaceae bacterium]
MLLQFSLFYLYNFMDIQCTKEELALIKEVAAAAKSLAVDAYLIGGFVRDKILGRNTKDMDFVCIGDGVLLAEKLAERMHPRPTIDIFKNFGTAHIRLQNGMDIEFVGARKESYNPDSRKPAVVSGTLEEDLQRRDFTINAFAISLQDENFGQLIDPFNGKDDIANKLIRTPLDPAQTFSDDPLRMMRAIRFATQLGFSIEAATWQGIIDTKDRIKIISQERITDELNKIILAEKPSIGFDLLFTSGLLQIIFPDMTALAGAEYKDGKGHKDNFYHTLQVVDNISGKTNDLWLRWAAVLHDIAKPKTKKFEEGHGWTFHGHEVVGGKMVPRIFAKMKLPQHENMRFVKKMVELHLRPISLTKENITDAAIRRLLFDAGDDFDSLMLLCEADITSKNKQKVKRFLENFQMVRERCKEIEAKDHIRNWQPPISGEIIMQTFGLSPSREVGLIKDALKEAMLDGQIENTYAAAYDFMLKKGKELGLKAIKI